MKDDRTEAQKHIAWCAAYEVCKAAGWTHRHRWVFIDPDGTARDLSAADLTKLDSIRKNNHFAISEP